MNTIRSIVKISLLPMFLLWAPSCINDPELPDNLVQFGTDEAGLTPEESELVITVTLVRSTSEPGTATMTFEATGLTYGTDFVTEPAAAGGVLELPIPGGAASASFKLMKIDGALYDGDEQIVFTLTSVSRTLLLGGQNQLTVLFSEIVAASGEMEVNGGGVNYPNKVFIDLSANRQSAVLRTTWDFAFSTSSEFRVILNSSNGMMARALDKTDLTAVTAADTVGWGVQLSLSAVFAALTTSPVPSWVSSSVQWIDDPAGDITKTALAAISSIPSENKVYIVNLGSGPGSPAPALGWKKVRIVRNGDGYTLQHADIGSTTFSEVLVSKPSGKSFEYVSLANGVVEVAPATDRWEIAWTGFTNTTGSTVGLVPYYFQDIILQNTTGVQTVQVATSTVTYEAFGETNLAGLDFGAQSQLKIGSGWRSGGGPGVSPAVRTDRFYVVRDADNNYYKLRFTSLTSGGERGRPRFEFSLVKKGS